MTIRHVLILYYYMVTSLIFRRSNRWTEEAQEQLSEMGEATDDSFITQTSAKKRQIIMDYTKTASNGYKGFDILDNNGNYKNTYDILLGIAEIYKEIQADNKIFLLFQT